MRLLFDEQLSEQLPRLLAGAFPESLHVRQLGAGGASDEVVWRLAAERGCLLVTKDEDFHRLSVLQGPPPKVIWLRVGNCTTVLIGVRLNLVESWQTL
jgi:predicted nuclease of predicted toxin-antitoxin system